MRWIVNGIAVMMLLVGVIWLLQGIGVLPGSFMSGQAFWAVMGLILIGASAAVFVLRTRRRPSNPPG